MDQLILPYGDSVKIPLVGRYGQLRGYAIVDASDAERLLLFSWRLTPLVEHPTLRAQTSLARRA